MMVWCDVYIADVSRIYIYIWTWNVGIKRGKYYIATKENTTHIMTAYG